MRVIALLAFCIVAVAAVPSNPQRIAGGFTTNIGRYPQNAALLYSLDLNTYWQACGGTIVNSRSILTAAHCPYGDPANRWRIRVGSTFANSGGVVHTVSFFIIHPSYSPLNADNDIAIIRSATTLTFNNNAAAASIAGTNYNIGDNQMVWATGWGATSSSGSNSEQLRHAQMWTVNQNTCNTRYGGVITANMLCAGWLDVGGRGQCQGDAGGPLYHNNVVVGISSWSNGCDQAFWPSVNTRISSYTTWIQANA